MRSTKMIVEKASALTNQVGCQFCVSWFGNSVRSGAV